MQVKLLQEDAITLKNLKILRGKSATKSVVSVTWNFVRPTCDVKFADTRELLESLLVKLTTQRILKYKALVKHCAVSCILENNILEVHGTLKVWQKVYIVKC